MTLTQLTYIIALDTYRHFAKAAEHCFVSQPTLSMQIQKLEDELALQIFDRNRTPIEPTEIGKKIINQARIAVSESKKIEDLISVYQNKIAGTFRIAIIPTIAPYLLPLFMKNFTEKYPEVELIIDELQTDVIIDHLQKDLIDIGILATPLNVQGLTEQPLYLEPFVAYMPEKHKLLNKKELTSDDLNPDELMLLDQGNCFREQSIQLCSKFKNRSDKQRLRFESGNLETLKKLVDKNYGVTILPFLMVKDFTQKSETDRCINFKSPTPKREISVVFSRNFLKHHITKAIVKEIKHVLPKELAINKDSLILPVFG
jgi:LysR family hydrogen peroxide-inducible transcriptional activator